MKKLLLSTSVFIFCINALVAQTSFGVTAGATFANMKFKANNVSVKSDTKVGFAVGLVADIAMDPRLSLQPALNFVQKGGEFGDDDAFGDPAKLTLNYLELPINIVYNVPTAAGRFFIGAGPSFSMGLSGKAKMGNVEEDVEFGSGDDEFKSMETGVNLLTGYRFRSGFSISANFNQGLSSLSNDDDDDAKVTNSYFGLKLGMRLGK